MNRIDLDGVLILGAGLAGLSAARAASPCKTLVISPAPLGHGCASAWAQGGMAVALSPQDSPKAHADDTVEAGAGIVDAEAALALTTAGPDAVRLLAELGAPFDRDAEGRFLQSLEAAHSLPRVARVGGDGAGRAILQALAAAALSLPSVEVWAPARARALLKDGAGRVRGALIERDGQLIEVVAHAVVLATGGAGGLYAVTTDPAAVRGEGLGLAALAGAVIADPEFVQFHPTALDLGLDPAPLATEALRGEGAVLVSADGRRFMDRYDARGELAPRDVVARAIHAERAAGRPVSLDATQAVGPHFSHEFPAVFAACMAAGIDPRVSPMPVAPAVHYHMGGVSTDMEGRASLPGLYAAGEVGCTGVHGANRLASNSLLEAAVVGARAGGLAAQERDPGTAPLATSPTPDLPPEAFRKLRRAMDEHAGVVREARGLAKLLWTIDGLEQRHGPAPTLVAARLIAACALERRESRGAHFRSDFPQTEALGVRTFTTLKAARRVVAKAPLETAPLATVLEVA